MAFVTPQLIPKKKENGGQGLANWRQSPGLKPSTSPKPMPIDAPSVVLPTSTENLFDDHLVHISVANVTRAEIERALLPEVGYATSHAFGYLMHIGKPTTIPLEREVTDSNPDSKNDSLSGPAAHFKTPKSELITNGGTISTPTYATPDAPPAAANKHGLPSMELPPAAASTGTPTSPAEKASEDLFIAVYGTHDAADNARHLIKVAFPRATVTIMTRRRGTTNSTLVLKGVPFQTRIDSLVENLTNHLSFKPSYTRLHRSERGVFKCVMFLKFSTRTIAEHAKYELERITVGTRPLRVEFKKQQRESVEAQTNAGTLPSSLPSNTAVSGPASLTAGPPPAYSAAVKGSLLTPVSTPAQPPTTNAPYTIMEQTLTAIINGDCGGCVYTASELKVEDIRYLSHLCTVAGLQMTAATPANVPAEASISLPVSSTSITPEHLLIRKRPPPTASPSPGGIMDRGSPQSHPISTPKFTPRVVPTTPQWTAHTPGSLQPMDFRGIRHWKEVRQEANSQATGNTGAALGIIRPLGPDSSPGFGAGRGRPAR